MICTNKIYNNNIVIKSLKPFYSNSIKNYSTDRSDHELDSEIYEFYKKKKQQEKENKATFIKDTQYFSKSIAPKLKSKKEPFFARKIPLFPYFEKKDFGNLSYNDRSFYISYKNKYFKNILHPWIYDLLSNVWFLLPKSLKLKLKEAERKYDSFEMYNEGSCKEYNINYDRVKSIKSYSCNHCIVNLFKIKPLLENLPVITSIQDFNLDLISPTSNIYKQFNNILNIELSFINRNIDPVESRHIYSYLLASVNFPNNYYYITNNHILKLILYSGYYQLVDNEAIIKEIDTLNKEDLKDILMNRSLNYKDLELSEMKAKFLKYSSLLKQLYKVEHGKAFNVDDLKIKNGWKFGSYKDNFPFNNNNSDWSPNNKGNLVKMDKLKDEDNYISIENSVFFKQFILFNCLLNYFKL